MRATLTGARIRVFNASNATLNAVWVASATNPSGGAAGLAVLSDGSAVFFSEPGLHRVSAVYRTETGGWSARVTLAGNGTAANGTEEFATEADITSPGQLALVNDALLYFLEGGPQFFHLRCLNLSTGWLATIVGGPTASVALSNTRADNQLPDGGISALLTGAQTNVTGPGTTVAWATTTMGGVAADAAGNVFFTDGGRVRQLWPNGSAITTIFNLAGSAAWTGDGGRALSATGPVGGGAEGERSRG